MGKPIRFLRKKEVLVIAGGISKMTLWRWMKNGHFPKPVNMSGALSGGYAFGWVDREIEDWVQARIDARDAKELKST